jgi:electron transfer flavoprotein alpha subunit
MPGVWVLAENRAQTLELLTIGRSMAMKMKTSLSVFLCQDRESPGDYAACGADEVLLLPEIAEDQSLDAYIPILSEEAGISDPDLFLIASTFRLKEIAARVATILNTGLCSECIKLCFNDESGAVEMERLMYGGAAVQRVICRSRPIMVTIQPGTFERASAELGREGQIRSLKTVPRSASRILERKHRERESKDIREARVVVCVGRGVEKNEDIALARELAEVLGGEIGGTRPVTEEMHWLPEELCIGLSGIQIKPDLYVGLGVSGQIQNVTGFRDAKVICAVNQDVNAPIFGVADMGIVGDLYDVVPRLIQEFKKQS